HENQSSMGATWILKTQVPVRVPHGRPTGNRLSRYDLQGRYNLTGRGKYATYRLGSRCSAGLLAPVYRASFSSCACRPSRFLLLPQGVRRSPQPRHMRGGKFPQSAWYWLRDFAPIVLRLLPSRYGLHWLYVSLGPAI